MFFPARSLMILALALAPSLTHAASPTAAPAPAADPIPVVAEKAGDFSTLLTAVEAAGLGATLSGEGPFTVFAPTNEAFEKLPEGALDGLLADPAALTRVLKFHVVAGKVLAADVKDGMEIKSLDGATLTAKVGEDGVHIGGAKVVAADVAASNGVIHVIDTVLLPPPPPGTIVEELATAGQFTTLLAALEATGLKKTLSLADPYTLFAPTDEAFAKLPEGTVEALLKDKEKLHSILLHHVVVGTHNAASVLATKQVNMVEGGSLKVANTPEGVKVGAAKVVKADHVASNGLIHIIDTVLLPQ